MSDRVYPRRLPMNARDVVMLVATMLLLVVSTTRSTAADDPLVTSTRIDYQAMKAGFRQIPDAARMRCFWFWLNGVATKESITRDLEAMKAVGCAGALIGDNGYRGHPRGEDTVFMSENWLANFGHAVKEADRLGIELSVNIQSGFGDPGNPNISPANAMKKIVHRVVEVTGPRKYQEKLPHPHGYHENIAVQAFPTPQATDDASLHQVADWQSKALFRGYLAGRGGMRRASPDDVVLPRDKTVDLTPQLVDGVLTWDVPEGRWTIVRYDMVPTGKRNSYAHALYPKGYCYDQLNRNGIQAQWNDVVRVMVEVAQENGDSLKYVHSDSWEMGMTNWTQGMLEKFKARRGYDMAPYLPVLAGRIAGSREISNRFLEDFRRTLADLVVEENYAAFKQLAHNNGLLLHSESGGPHNAPIDALETLGANDVPMSEFWARANTHRRSESQRIHVKQGSCAAHIYGKRYLAAEGPTSVGPQWERSPRELKGVLDKVFCLGVNRLFWHTYTSAPEEFGLPGLEYFAGTHMNRHVTWFQQADAFVDYINRCQHLLSQGLYRADVLSYYGSDVPNYVFLESQLPLPAGYKWDMCNSDVLLNRASAKDGRVYLPDGMNYALLHLDPKKCTAISLPVLKKIEQMVQNGVVLVGQPPMRPFGLTGYPQSDAELRAIVQRLWGDIDQKSVFTHQYGKGRVYAGKSIAEVLEIEKIRPDFSYQADEDVDLSFIHRFADDVDIYYVANKWAYDDVNQSNYERYRFRGDLPNRYVRAVCQFRVDGERAIERFDPVTGQITPVAVYRREEGYYELPVALGPEGSAFLVFRKAPAAKHATGITRDGTELIAGNAPLVTGAADAFLRGDRLEVLTAGRYSISCSDGQNMEVDVSQPPANRVLDGTWEITFMERPELGEPFRVETDTLKSWTEFPEHRIKYYSGTARYRKTFTVSADERRDKRVYLDLGNVLDIVTIRLNGEEVRTCWIAPFRVDVTDYLRAGENVLELNVTNSWPNRLIGDGKLPPEERRTAGPSIAKFQKPGAENLLRTSGLLGPVTLRSAELLPTDSPEP